jgi:hypothetical protein
MSVGAILVILLIIFLVGGFRGYDWGFGNRGIGVLGVLQLVVIVLMLLGRI